MVHNTKSRPRVIETETDIRDGVRTLRRKCRVLRRVHDQVGDPPLRRLSDGFEGLARIIVAQQLSKASAAAIWTRTVRIAPRFGPKAVLAANDARLRAAGLSRGKIRTLRALAVAVADDGLDLESLQDAPSETIHQHLTAVSGIGPWTADVYIMFCLGRADAWVAGDLALQLAAQRAFALRRRPTPAELLEIAERWRPWRAVAARLLWAYHVR